MPVSVSQKKRTLVEGNVDELVDTEPKRQKKAAVAKPELPPRQMAEKAYKE